MHVLCHPRHEPITIQEFISQLHLQTCCYQSRISADRLWWQVNIAAMLEAEVAMLLWQQSCQDVPTSARLNPETSIVVQKHHPYTGNLNSAMSGDGQNAFLHCGEVGFLPHFEA